MDSQDSHNKCFSWKQNSDINKKNKNEQANQSDIKDKSLFPQKIEKIISFYKARVSENKHFKKKISSLSPAIVYHHCSNLRRKKLLRGSLNLAEKQIKLTNGVNKI